MGKELEWDVPLFKNTYHIIGSIKYAELFVRIRVLTPML